MKIVKTGCCHSRGGSKQFEKVASRRRIVIHSGSLDVGNVLDLSLESNDHRGFLSRNSEFGYRRSISP